MVGQEKCDIDKGALWPKPVKDNCSNNRNVDLSKSDSQFDSQIDRYISCILIEVKMSDACKNRLPNDLVEEVEGGLNRVSLELGKQIRHLIIFCFNFL